MSWYEMAEEREEALIEDLSGLLRIDSVYDPDTSGPGQPMGQGVAEALQYMLDLCAAEGFRVRNLDGYVGYAEFGPESAENYVAVLSHLDVVPASGKWTTPPFEPSVRGGKIFARGAEDDKGPAMAAFYGLKIVKDMGLPLKHRIRLIFGTDEERTGKCMQKYNELEPAPICGFTPDADFPIVRAEKGQINTRLLFKPIEESDSSGYEYRLRLFTAGEVANSVPEGARAEVAGDAGSLSAMQKAYEDYCASEGQKGSFEIDADGQTASLSLTGKTAHGMEPQLGINAGLKLIHFLKEFSFPSGAEHYLHTVDALMYGDIYGRAFGIAMEDQITGPLTVNTGLLKYDPEGESYFHINLRYPVCGNQADILENIGVRASACGLEIEPPSLKHPHCVPDDHPMIEALQRVYEAETGQPAELLSTGGGTYAAYIANGVAFGPVFPGMANSAHQRNEHIDIDALIRSTAIYARAMHELANLNL
ncbi:dipeptidase PepV [Paenibacillus favisporus]|uniref:dipeptidase PepV n=1 Tax=Paenibacillus favisporus TaxID=221028 RepID=UPI002DB641C3|nr:dipeptidase PepV [Paenibacillus favisporus]MEC0179099.1 dipeptidase PepV [Paenibacillus favisporus]